MEERVVMSTESCFIPLYTLIEFVPAWVVVEHSQGSEEKEM